MLHVHVATVSRFFQFLDIKSLCIIIGIFMILGSMEIPKILVSYFWGLEQSFNMLDDEKLRQLKADLLNI